MDKLRHPQVIQTWKARQTQKIRSKGLRTVDFPRVPDRKPIPVKHG
jgi:hypothetical protein